MKLPFFPAHSSHHCPSVYFHHYSSSPALFSSSATRTHRWPLMDSVPIVFNRDRRKEKVIVIMGATGAGKSSLSIDLATRFPFSEIINSDKMQVYRGLDITTNKIRQSISPPTRSPLGDLVGGDIESSVNFFLFFFSMCMFLLAQHMDCEGRCFTYI